MVVDALHGKEHSLLLAGGQDLAQTAQDVYKRQPLALDGPAREPMKLTLDAAALGLTGQALADHLRQNGMECEHPL